jgi:hypothetical protein
LLGHDESTRDRRSDCAAKNQSRHFAAGGGNCCSPGWRLSLRETPVLAGSLLGAGFISLQVIAFFLLRHLLAR